MALIPGSSTTDPRYANYVPGRPLTSAEMALRASLGAAPQSSQTNMNASNYQPAPSGSVLGAATGGGGGVPTGGGGTPSGPSEEELARRAYEANVRAIQDLFGAGKQQVQDERNNANKKFDDIKAAVASFIDRAGTLKQNAGQEIVNQQSDILGTNAANAQGLVGKATGAARSLGLGLSSRLNIGQGLLRDLAGTQGNTIAKGGEQNRANDALFQQRIDTGEQTQREGQTARDAALAAADTYDRTNVATFGDNLGNAQSTFAGLLNNIANYNRQLNTVQTPNASSLTSYAPDMSGIVNTINSVMAALPSGAGATGATAPANLAAPTSLIDLLKRQGLYQGSTSL